MQQDYSNLTEYAANNIAQLKCELEKHFLELYGSSTEPIQFYSAPARINIIIEERTPAFLITPALDAVPISAITTDGVFIDREYMPISPKFHTYKIITYGVRGDDYEKWNKERVDEILCLTKAIETYGGQKIEYIDLRNPSDVYIKLEKVLIRFGEINDTALKRAKWIATILPEAAKFKQKIKYIDLRWDDAHYIKLDEATPVKPENNDIDEQSEIN